VTVLLFLIPATGWSQERVQADVKIESVSVAQAAGSLTCRVKVFSDHDDNAHDTTLRILLPVGVRFLRASTRCRASRAFHDGTRGVLTCLIGDLEVGASRTVQVVTTLPPAGFEKTFGAFAWSITPDPAPANNYGEGKP
jgi:Domain of unknown function DUF11